MKDTLLGQIDSSQQYIHSDPEFGEVSIAFQEGKPADWELMATLINVSLNIISQITEQTAYSEQPLKIERFTFMKPLAGGVMAYTWLTEIKLIGNETPFPLLVKVVDDKPGAFALRMMLTVEVVAADLISKSPRLNRLPQCLAYSFLKADQSRAVNFLPKSQRIQFHEPVNYLPIGRRTAFIAQEYIPSNPLTAMETLNDMCSGYLSYAMWLDAVYAETGIIHVDCQSANAIVPEGTNAAIPIDFAGIYHSEECPLPLVCTGNCPNGQPPLEQVTETTMYAFARRTLLLNLLNDSLGNNVYQEIALYQLATDIPSQDRLDRTIQEVFAKINSISLIGNSSEELNEKQLSLCEQLFTDLYPVILDHLESADRAAQLTEFILNILINPHMHPTFAEITLKFLSIYNPELAPALRSKYEAGL